MRNFYITTKRSAIDRMTSALQCCKQLKRGKFKKFYIFFIKINESMSCLYDMIFYMNLRFALRATWRAQLEHLRGLCLD